MIRYTHVSTEPAAGTQTRTLAANNGAGLPAAVTSVPDHFSGAPHNRDRGFGGNVEAFSQPQQGTKAMKCIQMHGADKPVRVEDFFADCYVGTGKARYVTKAAHKSERSSSPRPRRS